MEKILKEDLIGLFTSIGKLMTEKEAELEALDSMLGDGDLGLTMKKGFTALPSVIGEQMDKELSKIIMSAGMKMSSIVPSTMGFLMGSGLMSAGKALKDRECIESCDLVLFLKGFEDGIIKRGKCSIGERTVLDSIHEAALEAELAFNEKKDIGLKELALRALEGAKRGLEATKEMEPKYGKAVVHKAKAKGVADQGALAGYFVVEGICTYIQGEE